MIRGVDSRQEVDPSLLLRDTSPLGTRILRFVTDPFNTAVIMVAFCGIMYLIPLLADLLFLMGVGVFIYSATRTHTLPFRLPKVAKIKDYNDLKPGIKTPNTARGIAFFGNSVIGHEELWFNNEDLRTHVLIFGSTGSGKTEALVSFAYNALIHGSGFIYVDGKGDNSLYAKVFSMVRSMGREDDLLIVNFMTGARDIVGPQSKRLSNTLNPFATGSSSMLSQLVVSLMDSSSQSPDGDMWKGRAIAFVEALMKILVHMRDEGVILLDANTIRNYFLLSHLESIVLDSQFPRDKQDPYNIDHVPDLVLEPIRNYLLTLPGYNKEKKGKQVSQVLEQHGFITMQLTRVFTSLADTYGHILRTNLAEVDFKDVVLNRRILVVLLPALEKSPDELSNLGKVIIASLKAMMAAGLGEEVEGFYRDVIERKPTNAPSPFMCILDEYGYYAVQGFAVVPAQARSLGFCTVFAGQDLPAFQKASKEEAASIGANTNIKICMKLEDPTETWEFFTKTAGEAYVTKVDAFQTRETSVTNAYMDTKSSSFEKRARIDLLDLKEQTEGEAHIFFRSKIVRAKLFYANPKPAKKIKINQFVKVDLPPDDWVTQSQNQLIHFRELLQSGDTEISGVPSNEDIDFMVNALRDNDQVDPIERGVGVLMAFHNRDQMDDEIEDLFEEELDNELNIFIPYRQSIDLPIPLSDDLESFSQPLITRNEARSQLIMIERMAGRVDRHAASVGSEIIKDMQLATHYPPESLDDISASDLSDIVNELCQHIINKREEEETPSLFDDD